jgi:hypothetical protein
MVEQDAPSVARPSKPRSPNHPAFSLPKALEKIELFMAKARMSPVPPHVACDYMKVKATSSSGMRWQAALQEFGLLMAEGRGKDKTLKATEIARILVKHPDKSSEEFRQALRNAALAPSIHQRVWALRAEDGHLPPDESLRWTLCGQEWGFSEYAVDAFIAQFRETIAFSALTEEPVPSETDADEDPPEDDPPKPPKPTGGKAGGQPWKTAVTDSQASKDIPIPLQSGGTAVLHLPYLLDEQDYEWMRTLLDGLKRSMLARSAPQPPQPEPSEDGP